MTKPRYFSVKTFQGVIRGFLFVVMSTTFLATLPIGSYGQDIDKEPSGTWLLLFGSDSLILQKPVPSVDVQELLYEAAWRHGYFRSKLTSSASKGDSLLAIFTSEGRFRWSDTPIEWVSQSSNNFSIQDCHLSDKWYDATDLEACLLVHTNQLMQSGYLRPTVVLDSLLIDDSNRSVSAIINITDGEVALLSDVTWIGLSKTGSPWLERAAGIQPGMVLNEANINRTLSRLYQTKLFEGIAAPEIYLNGETWGLIYSVSERPLTFFDLLVGYVPDLTGKAVIAGTGSLHVRNAGFDGTDLKMNFDRQSPRVGRFLVSVDQNLLFGLPFGISSSFSLVRQDTLWQNRSASLGVWWDVHDNVRVHTALNREVSAAASTSQGSADLWGTYGEIGIVYDSRNDFDLTSGGLLVNLVAESGRQIVDPHASERFNQNRKRLRGSVDVHLSLTPRNVLIPGFTAGTILSDKAPYVNDLWRIGGTKSLRGYREDQFYATSYLWGNVEYRFLLDPYSYLFTFGSTGRLWLPANDLQRDITVQKNVGSFGFGLAYQTNLGLLKFTYAKSPEDPFSNAKVHIGITSGF